MTTNSNCIEKFITSDGGVRAASIICTSVIEEARIIHDTFPVASAALGRTLIGAALMASFLKERGKIALYFKGDGPLGSVFGEATSEGHLRGFVTHPQIHVPSKNGKLNVGGGVGSGILSVAQSLPGEKQPYTGSVPIQSGEIGEDLAFYLYQSQQTSSIVALGVFVETDNHVSAAGGTLLQVMPGASDETLRTLEERVKKMRSVTDLIRSGATTSDLAFEILEDFKFQQLDDGAHLEYKCQCSLERVERSITLLGVKEIQAMLDEKKPTEVTCDFCGRHYLLSLEQLGELLKRSLTN